MQAEAEFQFGACQDLRQPTSSEIVTQIFAKASTTWKLLEVNSWSVTPTRNIEKLTRITFGVVVATGAKFKHAIHEVMTVVSAA
jgi:hypothetical protein